VLVATQVVGNDSVTVQPATVHCMDDEIVA
jgi:hypothetical protein